MKELKKLTKMELIKIRAMHQLAHQIGYMNNKILRSASNLERYKIRNELKTILSNIDNRIGLLETRLYHKGGAKIRFDNCLPLYVDKSIAFFTIDNIDNNISNLILRFMGGYSINYIIKLLIKIRDRLSYTYKISELPKCDLVPFIFTKYDNEILEMNNNDEVYNKYKYIYNALKDNPILNTYYPDMKIEDNIMKICDPDGNCLLYLDTKERFIASLPTGINNYDNYVYRRKALNKIIREIDKLIDGGIK